MYALHWKSLLIQHETYIVNMNIFFDLYMYMKMAKMWK